MRDRTALIIGNSDGIGLALTKKLLSLKWHVTGLSRSPSPIENDAYDHSVIDVTDSSFTDELRRAVSVTPELTVYCAGIGEAFDISAVPFERTVFEVNLIGAVRVIEAVLPNLIANRSGQIIVLSSLADIIVSPEAPSYSASKAALSSFVEGVALAVRHYGVAVTNVRFGFVDTKMAKGDKQLLMMTVDKAVEHLLKCIRKQPIRYSRPRFMAVLVLLARWFVRAKMIFIGPPH